MTTPAPEWLSLEEVEKVKDFWDCRMGTAKKLRAMALFAIKAEAALLAIDKEARRKDIDGYKKCWNITEHVASAYKGGRQ